MTGYLPTNVQLGDKLRLVPYALNKQDNGNEHCQKPHALTGQVIYIHPQRRYATVRFPLTGCDSTGHQVDKSFRECWSIMPDERRLAHGNPNPDPETGRPAGSRGKPGATIRKRLQERDWTGMTQGQIAKELGVGQMSVNRAITALKREGIEINYAKGLTFTQAAQARKAAAGSTSSDSGK